MIEISIRQGNKRNKKANFFLYILDQTTYPIPANVNFGGILLKVQQNPSSVDTIRKSSAQLNGLLFQVQFLR